MGPFDYDRYLVDQLIRPIANLYRVTPLAAGETPAGPPIAYVRQKKMKIKEDIRFFADESETQELFQIKARTWLDTGGSKYDVVDAQEGNIGLLEHVFGKSLFRSTWRISTPDGEEIAIARERSQPLAILRRVIDFVPDVGGLIPIPYNFDLLAGEQRDREDGPEVPAARPLRARPLRRSPSSSSTAAWRSRSRSASTRCRTAQRLSGARGSA